MDELNQENKRLCLLQIQRFEGTAFFNTLSTLGKGELASSLCFNNDSHNNAEMMVTMRLRDTSLTPRGEIRGTICPTPADFAAMAQAIRQEARAAESWKPAHLPKAITCQKCYGSGWHVLYELQTREDQGGSAFTKTESITREVFDSFNGGKLNPQTQAVYSSVKRCGCGPSREQMETSAAREKREQDGRKFDREFPRLYAEAVKRAEEKRKDSKSMQRIGSYLPASNPSAPAPESPPEPPDTQD